MRGLYLLAYRVHANDRGVRENDVRPPGPMRPFSASAVRFVPGSGMEHTRGGLPGMYNWQSLTDRIYPEVAALRHV